MPELPDQSASPRIEPVIVTEHPIRPWAAFVLSLLLPGFGHIYVGQPMQGLRIWGGYYLLFGSLLIAWPYLFPSGLTLAAIVVSGFACLLIIAGIAYATAKRARSVQPDWYRRWYGLLLIYLACGIVATSIWGHAVRHFVKGYRIPAASMLPTIMPGDHITSGQSLYALKTPFSDTIVVKLSSPRRGDLIIFKYPKDETKDFIKRVIGLPGEMVEMRNRQIYIDGEPLDEPYIQFTSDTNVDRRDNFGPELVPPESYFVLGDNRDQSLDSRFWGFVRENKIRGKAILIYWSVDPHTEDVRWRRIGAEFHDVVYQPVGSRLQAQQTPRGETLFLGDRRRF
jgi:signal peptidase I